MKLAIVIVSWNCRAMLDECLAAVPRATTVVVVDNASSDGTVEHVRAAWPHVRVIANQENRGFAAANNQGFSLVDDADYVLVLNPDAILAPGALDFAIDYLEQHRDIGLLGLRLLNSDGTLQPSSLSFPRFDTNLIESFGLQRFLPRAWQERALLGTYWAHDQPRDVDWVFGAWMLLRRRALKEAGGFSEEYFLYGEDMALCKRVWDAGWRVHFHPTLGATHRRNQSAKQRSFEWRLRLSKQGKYLFCKRQHGELYARAMQVQDLVGATLRTLRNSPDPAQREISRTDRKVVWEALWQQIRSTRPAK